MIKVASIIIRKQKVEASQSTDKWRTFSVKHVRVRERVCWVVWPFFEAYLPIAG